MRHRDPDTRTLATGAGASVFAEAVGRGAADDGAAGRRRRRLVVAVSGGSGIVYAHDLLRSLREVTVETHLIVTAGAKHVMASEPGTGLADLEALAEVVHKDADLGAAVASGSFRSDGMVVVPCSAGTLAKIATGFTDNLVSRAAHVALKERRPLVLVVREAPYSRPMLRNMLSAFDAGAVILPAAPGFYHDPQTIEDLIGSVTARVLDHLGIDNERTRRWKEPDD